MAAVSGAVGVPTAELHLHQEVWPRLELLAAERRGRAPFDWRAALENVAACPPGRIRLDRIYEPDPALDLDGASDDDADFVLRVSALLAEAAGGGAVLAEVRFGSNQVERRPDFMGLFRDAEARVQRQHRGFVAEAIGFVVATPDRDRHAEEETKFAACLRAASHGLGGVDFITDPYDHEAPAEVWTTLERWVQQAHDAGLGITIHAGEFCAANLARAARLPHVRRLGHAVYADRIPGLLDELASRDITIESCLTSNVVLGAVSSYEEHPIRTFVAAGVRVALSTDLPIHLCTTIDREYERAAALGFGPRDLLKFTENAVEASFTTPARRARARDAIARFGPPYGYLK